MAYEDVAKSTVQQAMDQGRNVAEKAGQSVKDGYEAVQQYAEDNGLSLDVGDFVRREPWLAITAILLCETERSRCLPRLKRPSVRR